MTDDVLGPPGFRVSSRRVGPHVVVVEVAGEIDMETVGRAKACVDTCLAEGLEHLVVDLSGVTFLSSAGVSLLLETRKEIAGSRGALHLLGVTGNRFVSRPLDLMGLSDLFDTVSDLAAVPAVPGTAEPDGREA